MEDGGEAQRGLVHLLALGLASPIGNKDSSIRGVCIEGSMRSLLVPKSRMVRNFRVSLAATVVRRLEVGVTICGRPPGGP